MFTGHLNVSKTVHIPTEKKALIHMQYYKFLFSPSLSVLETDLLLLSPSLLTLDLSFYPINSCLETYIEFVSFSLLPGSDFLGWLRAAFSFLTCYYIHLSFSDPLCTVKPVFKPLHDL